MEKFFGPRKFRKTVHTRVVVQKSRAKITSKNGRKMTEKYEEEKKSLISIRMKSVSYNTIAEEGLMCMRSLISK